MKQINCTNDNLSSKILIWCYFLIGILYCIVLLFLLENKLINNIYIWSILLVIGALIGSRPYQTLEAFGEYFYIVITWLIFQAMGLIDQTLFFLPLITTILISLTNPLKTKLSTALVWLFVGTWFIFGEKTSVAHLDLSQYIVIVLTLIMLVVYTSSVFRKTKILPRKVDFILCSYSGNTAHYADAFVEGMKQEGAEIVEHRFHYYQEFNPNLQGDSLVIAFPIFGLKPPSSLLNYLFIKLPKGNGKPAFILSTAGIGGPENGEWLTWFILSLKGYRVLGRNWAIYPVNVPVVRIGPKKLWNYIDSLFPLKRTIEYQINTGKNYTKGLSTGLPIIFWPSPFTIIGMIIENEFFNRIYRNHVIRKRCNGCGACASYCPAQRIQIVNGYPKVKGTCTLCLGCINNCPRNAMRMWFWLEFGNVYKSKWKEYVVTNKDSIKDC